MSTITTLNDWITGASFRSQVNTNFSNLDTDKAELSGATFTGDIIVPAEVYWAGWNWSNKVPTKNDLYDKIETITGNQTIANTSDATSHTVTLSATGGSVKLVEWSWITLTTTGTSADGIVTIASTGGAWLTNFTEGVNTSAPNATIPVVSMTATNAAANVDVAIVPKGTWAFTLAVADNLATGGNKRGANAIDLQTNRFFSTDVASGSQSIAIWTRVESSSLYSIAIWRESKAQWVASIAIWYTSIASGVNSTAIWRANIASWDRSTAIWSEWTSQAFWETTLWLYPTTGAGNATTYVSTDRLLVVGNWTTAGARSDAVTVLKNGNTTIAGTLSNWTSNSTTTGNIELGHATDTTISRVSAGKIAVEGVNVGTEGILQNSQSTAYTLVLTDAGKSIYHPSADTTARTWTIPANSSVAFPIGTAVTFVNDTSAWTLTIAITTDTLILAGSGATGSRTLTANGIATAIKVTSTRWIISGTSNLT